MGKYWGAHLKVCVHEQRQEKQKKGISAPHVPLSWQAQALSWLLPTVCASINFIKFQTLCHCSQDVPRGSWLADCGACWAFPQVCSICNGGRSHQPTPIPFHGYFLNQYIYPPINVYRCTTHFSEAPLGLFCYSLTGMDGILAGAALSLTHTGKIQGKQKSPIQLIVKNKSTPCFGGSMANIFIKKCVTSFIHWEKRCIF